MSKAIEILSLVLTAMGQGALANQLTADFANGKITVDEGIELEEALAKALETYLPKEAPELELAAAIGAAVDAYLKAKAAAAPPAAAPPAAGSGGSKNPPGTGAGGPSGTIRS